MPIKQSSAKPSLVAQLKESVVALSEENQRLKEANRGTAITARAKTDFVAPIEQIETPNVASDLGATITSLIAASKQLDDFSTALPSDFCLALDDLNRIIVRLGDLRRKIATKHAASAASPNIPTASADPGPIPAFLNRASIRQPLSPKKSAAE
jgi:hypothetical protein